MCAGFMPDAPAALRLAFRPRAPWACPVENPPDTTCPVCNKRGPWSDAEFRPFCSQRCKQIDLGKWFAGDYKFSEPLRPSHFGDELEEHDDASPGGPSGP